MNIERHPSLHRGNGRPCSFREWLVDDGYHVGVGDAIYSYEDGDNNAHTDFSEHSGIISLVGGGIPSGTLKSGDLMYVIHSATRPKIKLSQKPCYVYLFHDTANGFYKIGISIDPQYRERTLQGEKPTIVALAAKRFPIRKIARSFEGALHQAYKEKNIRGEWYALNEVDVAHITESLT